MKRKVLGVLIALSMITGLYATCYIEGFCTCVTVGQCYGNVTPNGCQTPTCIIADVNATIWNTCQGAGTYTGRQTSSTTTCFISACRIYNNCTHQYEQPPGGCNYMIPYYTGVGSGCH